MTGQGLRFQAGYGIITRAETFAGPGNFLFPGFNFIGYRANRTRFSLTQARNENSQLAKVSATLVKLGGSYLFDTHLKQKTTGNRARWVFVETSRLVDRPNHYTAMFCSSQLTSEAIMSFMDQSEILNQRRSVEIIRGIYFLFRGEQIVYVGQSNNALLRIYGHSNGADGKNKNFDGFTILPCPDLNDQELAALEAYYILSIDPEYNGSIPPNNRYKSKLLLRDLYQVDIRRLTRVLKELCIEPIGRGYFDLADLQSKSIDRFLEVKRS